MYRETMVSTLQLKSAISSVRHVYRHSGKTVGSTDTSPARAYSKGSSTSPAIRPCDCIGARSKLD
jgi:hypothetical protein